MRIPPETAEAASAFWSRVVAQEPAAAAELGALVPRVCTPVLRALGVPGHDLDDLLQETYLSTWRYASKHAQDPPRNFAEFLKWRARACFREYLRRRTGRRESVSVESILEPMFEGEGVPERLVRAELRGALSACVEELTPKYREVWEARSARGWTPAETASSLGIARGTVAVRLHRAAAKLEACIRGRLGEKS